MSQSHGSERRKHVRYPIATAVKLLHAPSGREFPARSVDASRGGLLMYVPVGTPVAVGQQVSVGLGAIECPELTALANTTHSGRVVHVDRLRMPSVGYLPVGVRFDPE